MTVIICSSDFRFYNTRNVRARIARNNTRIFMFYTTYIICFVRRRAGRYTDDSNNDKSILPLCVSVPGAAAAGFRVALAGNLAGGLHRRRRLLLRRCCLASVT